MPSCCHLALLGLLATATAQTPTPVPPKTPLNHSLVFLDAAHGGEDAGARLTTRDGDQLLEKDLTLALTNRVRFQLTSLGLTVLSTREAEPVTSTPPVSPGPAPPSADQRASLANHVHPFACIVVHATGTGSGVHLITSALPPSVTEETLPTWDAAQTPFLAQSERLAAELSAAIVRLGVPVHLSHATLRPLDSLTCPAVVLEFAPLPSASLVDSGYQARLAQAVATSLLFWRGHAEPDAPPREETAAPYGAARP